MRVSLQISPERNSRHGHRAVSVPLFTVFGQCQEPDQKRDAKDAKEMQRERKECLDDLTCSSSRPFCFPFVTFASLLFGPVPMFFPPIEPLAGMP